MYQSNYSGGDRPRTSSRPGFKKRQSRGGESHNSFRKFRSGLDFKTGAQVTAPEKSERSFGASPRPSGERPRFGSSRPSFSSSRKPFGNRSGGFRGSRFGGRNGGGSRRNFKMGKGIDVARLINNAPVTEAPKEYVARHKFADFLIDERIKANVISKGYVTPTAIQDQAIPEVLKGVDVVGLANTGTGKTAAFLIPLIDKILKFKDEKVLIVVPTRELAIQIEEELRAFVRGLPIWGVVCVGGAPIVPQIKGLGRQHSFVIGTPGRLKDLIERKTLVLEKFKTVVLDEADRMLDMGFVNDIKYMMSLMSPDRQTLFFSATITPEIEGLIHKFLKNPVKVSVRTGDTSKSIAQDVVRVPQGQNKIDVLCELLGRPGFEKVLIFGRTKHGVERLSKDLNHKGIKTESIHGNKTHGKRQKALSLFKDHHVQALIATDVAARGLDISGVTHVINYDLPATYEDYVHRIGRTGRGGKTGIALSFVE